MHAINQAAELAGASRFSDKSAPSQQGICDSLYTHRCNLVADGNEDCWQHKALHVNLRKPGRAQRGTGIPAQITALK